MKETYEKYLNQITCGDSYKLIKELPDKSVDCIYVDIPYLFQQGGCSDTPLGKRAYTLLNKTLETIRNGIDYKILNEFIRVSKKLNLYIWCSKEQIPDIMNYFVGKGYFFDILVWTKTNPTPLCNNTWLPDVEYCLYFRETGVLLNDGYEHKSKWFTSAINKSDKDLFSHPTIKPLELVKRHLLHTTQPNDIVLDCFIGSGTTAVACKETGRQFIGFEIEPKWVKVANDRLNKTDANGQISMILR